MDTSIARNIWNVTFAVNTSPSLNLKYRYYNYGFPRHSYLACMECHSNLFGPFRLVDSDIVLRAYKNIIEVIKN
jgi:hypothetical protein